MSKAPKTDWLETEAELRPHFACIVGLDEAGCGCLAGPVVAGAVVLPEGLELLGLNDSKKLSALQRERIFAQIQSSGVPFAVGMASPEEIDALNIRKATYLAMQRAVASLPCSADYLLVDCWTLPFWSENQRGIVKGDAKVRSIAAASVVAKVSRDALMCEADALYPGYSFAQHKGYPTALHYRSLEQLGMSPLHRRSFVHDQQLELASPLGAHV